MFSVHLWVNLDQKLGHRALYLHVDKVVHVCLHKCIWHVKCGDIPFFFCINYATEKESGG
eukprot:747177-Ditylum_brightwellii.AAC.1